MRLARISKSENIFQMQSIHFRFRIQNLWTRDKTGTFLFQIYASACRRQNGSGTKMLRIRLKCPISPLV